MRVYTEPCGLELSVLGATAKRSYRQQAAQVLRSASRRDTCCRPLGTVDLRHSFVNQSGLSVPARGRWRCAEGHIQQEGRRGASATGGGGLQPWEVLSQLRRVELQDT